MKYKYSKYREDESDIFLEKLFNIARDRDIGFYNKEKADDYTWFGENRDDYYTLNGQNINLVQTVRIWNNIDLNVWESNFSKISEELGFSVNINMQEVFDVHDLSWYKLQITFKEIA